MSEQQKWAVLGDVDGDGWIVVHPGDIFRRDGRLDFWNDHSIHDTWEEAMQEADRMYRTTTVELPANPHRVLPVTHIRMYRDARIERTYRVAGYQEITISDEHREPLALALLAHARRDNRGHEPRP